VTAADSHATSGPAEAFIAELKHWRDVRGLSQSVLAKKVGYTPSYISKVEHGQQRPSTAFAEQADTVLRAGVHCGAPITSTRNSYDKKLRHNRIEAPLQHPSMRIMDRPA
jgi:transcriptional regulator with XRE-family HTH domain